MNNSRKWVVGIGVFLFIMSALFPPWLFTNRTGAGTFSENNAGYGLIFSPPINEKGNNSFHGIKLDMTRLWVEWLCISALAVSGLIFIRKNG